MKQEQKAVDKKPSSTDEKIKSTLMFSEHIRVTTMVVMINVCSIALLGGGGYLLDQSLETQPALAIAGFLLSFPVAQYIIYRWVNKSYVPSIVEKSKSQDS